MKKLSLAVGVIAAMAAPAALADNFAGAFVGAQVGAVTGTTLHNDLDYWYEDLRDLETSDESMSYGLRAGYNMKSGGLLFGVLAEYNMMDVDTVQRISDPNNDLYRIGTQVDELASLRLRAGLTDGKLAVMLSAGVAIQNADNLFNDVDGSNEYIRAAATETGLAYGLNAEYAVNENNVISLDISRYEFDGSNEPVLQGGAPTGNPVYRFTIENAMNVVGLSYNYKF